ncbi:MAG: Holliday junction resolvase Hjc [Nitrososphaeria archaeon]
MRSNESKSRRRGLDKERDLARKLWALGFASMRAPASGARVKRIVQPDVIAARDGTVLAFEVKARSEIPIYVDADQVEKLAEWARRAGARPFFAIYYGREWRFVPLDGASRVGRTYRIDGRGLSDALSIDELTA